MLKVCPLGSGSSGNSFYIGTDTEGILVDAGISCKAIMTGMGEIGIDSSAIKGICITHEHTDHIKGLRVLLKKIQVPIYASAQTLQAIIETNAVTGSVPLNEINQMTEIAGLGVTPFDTPHDVPHSLGFRIQGGERTVGYATDVGEITPEVWQGLQGSDLVVLEANYDDSLLAVSSYPYFLKQRIRSDLGHLSNIDSANCVQRLASTGTGRFILAHLSKDNNMPHIARQQVEMVLNQSGMTSGKDYLLQVASRTQITPPMFL